jgi:adenosine kinase
MTPQSPAAIFISGSIAYDRIMDFPGKFSDHILPDKIHILNVCFTVNGLIEKFGGTAGNIAYSLSLLNERPIILASAGQDFGRYQTWLEKNQLSTIGIRVLSDEFTAGAYITTDQSDNQITGFNPGAMKHSCGYVVKGTDGDEALGIISPGCLDDMLEYSRQFKANRISYISDPGQQIPVLNRESLIEIVTGSRLLVSNDYELEMILKATGLSRESILEKTSAIITTLGEKGSLVIDGKNQTVIPAVSADRVLDPTGAGDAYRAGLIKGLRMGKTLPAAARLGATCASFAVEQYGTQEHRFSFEQFNARHEACFGEKSILG